MLTVVTGLPGSGKTLWTMAELSKVGDRVVYFDGIPEVTLPWQALPDPRKWFDVPQGAVVVIDEAQRIFPPRRQGAEVPDWVREFETHRHKGLDVYLITQSAMLLDHHVRRLSGRHIHLKRVFGIERARVREWQRIANPDDYHDGLEAASSWFAYPRELFGVYKSADMHTVKKRVPWLRIAAVPVLAAVVVGLIWFGLSAVNDVSLDGVVPGGDLVGPPAPVAVDMVAQAGAGNPWSREVRADRLPDVPPSAPIYDALAEPVTRPIVAGCMRMETTGPSGKRVRCSCTDQQGFALPLGPQSCERYWRWGWFDDRRPDADYNAQLTIHRQDSSDIPVMSVDDVIE